MNPGPLVHRDQVCRGVPATLASAERRVLRRKIALSVSDISSATGKATHTSSSLPLLDVYKRQVLC